MSDADRIVEFVYEVGQLKRLPRAGWLFAGVPHPESVAAHSFRVGVLAHAIAVQEGANPDRAATLGLFHDVPEARTGDLPYVGKLYVGLKVPPQQVAADQVRHLPAPLAAHVEQLIAEHEAAKDGDHTPEARCSRDADKLELLLQAREYQAAGVTKMERFIQTNRDAVVTDTGRALLDSALRIAPSQWWEAFGER
ncbi:putative hydrolases of HD superfamily [Lentzea xinjiangensis]|uniref:5'-deoxynucleotidase n=1 Tax=Lentzea xinjiangensis TaxID=402600 RepID=A0A1H9EF60_9PSEU|nr:HD family hydrolase [Lentzea xinjiangensis]SEQ24222.1 putative hydrolases of HD superfamily [Lentzea xinjiangensis]